MALKKITTFTYRGFISEINGSALAIVDHFENKIPNFWGDTLRRYSFREYDYRRGEQVRLQFSSEISSCKETDELFDVSNKILKWGGMKPLNDDMKQGLKRSLSCLDRLSEGKEVDLKELCVERLASITKIYEMWDLDNWVIYDSFCAIGLQWMVSDYWQSIGYRASEDLLKLPWPPGRSGSPLIGFPKTGDTAPNQKRLGFIYGSWLCKAIAEHLNASSGQSFRWRPYHIEMIAFQIGHEINQ
ncbi:MAG TPA: hypothetical protein ENF70_04795 [Deltaproteobacteria bacterium]|nr:hypothetical protein [Deltaproteobacteria bacterium]HDH98429.1 hypothetical protein [Deltaproteobacteria bacterium]